MAAKKVVKLSVVRNKRVKANVRAIRDSMIDACRESATKLGDDLAGYALVVWDKSSGEPCVSYETDIGPVGEGMLAAFVSNAIATRVTINAIGDVDDEGSGES